jgi:hypothetical protein
MNGVNQIDRVVGPLSGYMLPNPYEIKD